MSPKRPVPRLSSLALMSRVAFLREVFSEVDPDLVRPGVDGIGDQEDTLAIRFGGRSVTIGNTDHDSDENDSNSDSSSSCGTANRCGGQCAESLCGGAVTQDILGHILAAHDTDAGARFQALRMVLGPEVRRLVPGVFPHSYYSRILRSVARHGAGLQHLDLKGVWAREMSAQLAVALRTVKRVKVLIVPHMVNDTVLAEIIQLKQLSILDISGDCAYSLDLLCQLKSNTIQVLYLGMFGKSDLCEDSNKGSEAQQSTISAVGTVIKNIPSLKALKTFSFSGLSLLELFESTPDLETNLIYIHDTATTTELFQAICKLCPNLVALNFIKPEKNVIKTLYNLNRLHSVKLSQPDMEELCEFLRNSEGRLQTLKLCLVRNGPLDLSHVAVTCPELTILECYKMPLKFRDPNSYFMALQNVEILYCDVTDTVVKCLLLNAPFLRKLIIGDPIHLTDGDVFRLCAESNFESLEELWFSMARSLTITSVELLMGHCCNLKMLGQLNNWDISVEEVLELKNIIKTANINLVLLPVEW